MPETYPIRILSQLSPVLQGFRKSRGLTQAALAAKLGVSQQSYARLEANPGRASLARVLAALQALEVELTLTPRGDIAVRPQAPLGPDKAGKPTKPTKPTKPAKSAAGKAAPGRRTPKGEDW